jgi:hypothetical protein
VLKVDTQESHLAQEGEPCERLGRLHRAHDMPLQRRAKAGGHLPPTTTRHQAVTRGSLKRQYTGYDADTNHARH